ncbi:MAG: hypothetical protein ACM3NR_00505 [Methanosarcina sp.]
MKKSLIIVCLMVLSLGISSAFAAEPDKNEKKDALPEKTENKLSEEELSRMNRRVEEIRDMDKSDMTAKEKKELKKELKGIKENLKAGGYIYIGAGTLLVIILLVILLL